MQIKFAVSQTPLPQFAWAHGVAGMTAVQVQLCRHKHHRLTCSALGTGAPCSALPSARCSGDVNPCGFTEVREAALLQGRRKWSLYFQGEAIQMSLCAVGREIFFLRTHQVPLSRKHKLGEDLALPASSALPGDLGWRS